MRMTARLPLAVAVDHISTERPAGAVTGRNRTHPEPALPALSLAAVVFATFVVALGYGTILPLLPSMIARLLETRDLDQIAQHTALLSGVFAFAPVLAARSWGRLSDRVGRRPVLAIGLIGFALTFVATAFPPSLPVFYLERLFNGAFAAAIVPSVLALVTDREADDTRRARAFGWVASASSIGLLAGPILGGFMADRSASVAGMMATQLSLVAFALVSGLAVAAAFAIIRLLPAGAPRRERDARAMQTESVKSAQLRLIWLSAIAAGGLGVFEVGLTIRSQALSIAPSMLGAMFAGCMVVMLLVQATTFSPLVKPSATRWLIAPAFVILGIGLGLVLLGDAETGLIVGTAAVAAAGGVLAPILAFWLSQGARGHSGSKLGSQSAALNLGQTLGSAGAGLLLGAAALSAAFLGVVAAAAAAVGIGLALGLKNQDLPIAAAKTATRSRKQAMGARKEELLK